SGDEGKPSLMDKYQFFAYFEPIALDPNRGIYFENFIKKYKMESLVGLFIIPLLYFVLLEGMSSATIGKFVTGIRVRRKDGGKISFITAFVRHMGRIVSTLIFMLGYLLAFIDSKRQTLHDKIANTMVLKKGTGI
ncbi:MAG: RDD family protein, partial [Chitinophagales bacterium]